MLSQKYTRKNRYKKISTTTQKYGQYENNSKYCTQLKYTFLCRLTGYKLLFFCFIYCPFQANLVYLDENKPRTAHPQKMNWSLRCYRKIARQFRKSVFSVGETRIKKVYWSSNECHLYWSIIWTKNTMSG